jgi:hypothetical protein
MRDEVKKLMKEVAELKDKLIFAEQKIADSKAKNLIHLEINLKQAQEIIDLKTNLCNVLKGRQS